MQNINIQTLSKCSINKNELKIVFLLIPYFRPEFISLIYGESILNKIFLVWRVLSFLYISLIYFKKKRKRIDLEFLLICLYSFFMLCSIYLNHLNFSNRIINIANFIGIYLVYKYYAEKKPYYLIKANFDLLSFFTIINALLTIIFPMGLNHSFNDTGRINFLGKDNILYLFFLLNIVFCVLYKNINKKSKMPLVIIIIIMITEVYYFSGSGMIAFSILAIYLVFLYKNNIFSIFLTPINILILFVIVECMIVLIGNVSEFSFIFEILGKDTTFSDRIYYWRAAINQIKYSPLYGLGSGTVNLWNNDYYAHNAILDVLMKGGIIGLCFWGIIIFRPFFKLNFYKNRIIKKFLIVVFACFLITGLMEGLEDRIAFNAFIALVSVFEYFDRYLYSEDIVIN